MMNLLCNYNFPALILFKFSDKSESALRLNALWKDFKYFLNDQDKNGQPVINTRSEKTIKRFETECKFLQMKAKGNLTIDNVKTILSRFGIQPLLTNDQLKDLFVALDVFKDLQLQTVDLSQIISAVSDRMNYSNQGYFAKKPVEEKNQFSEIRSLFKQNCRTFEDLLKDMLQNSNVDHNTKVFANDFEKVINRYKPGYFSSIAILNAFKQAGPQKIFEGIDRAFIPITDFKDVFYSEGDWQGDPRKTKVQELNQESMLLNDLMQARAIKEIMNERSQKEEQKDITRLRDQKSIKNEFESTKNLNERISNIIDLKSDDFYVQKPDKVIQSKEKLNTKGKKAISPDKTTKEVVSKTVRFTNPEFYMQSEVKSKVQNKKSNIDIDKLQSQFVTALLDDLHIAGGRNKPEYGSYVDKYGKEIAGNLSFNEIKAMYMAHVHYADVKTAKNEPPSDEVLRQLFNLLKPGDRNNISRDQFIRFLETKNAPSFRTRLQEKLKQGAKQLIIALKEECQKADILFGANGLIPFIAFETIMIDYDLPITQSDKEDLIKNGFLKQEKVNNELQNELIRYKEIFKISQSQTLPQQRISFESIIMIQKHWRGCLARRMKIRLLNDKKFSIEKQKDSLRGLSPKKGALKKNGKEQTPIINPKDQSPLKETREKSKEKMDPALKAKLAKDEQIKKKLELEKKKALALKSQRQGRRDAASLEKKMIATIKAPNTKGNDRHNKLKLEERDQIVLYFIEKIVNKAFCYGESLQVCREIQTKYENRPVIKYLYPLLQQFQFTSQGISSKSLQPFNQLGQIMFLNAQNQLQQYDIATNKSLPSVSLGTRPPLKKYNIIDMVVDQRSGRIYTINSNWILEIWNMEQNASFPQKRIAVCSNEGGRDFISQYYSNTFNDSKPRFLCLQESNQQVLVVNTTCVDGSIVFIDPISFSTLKKIQLRYSDYELPIKIRHNIKTLSKILNRIQDRTGKDLNAIFTNIVNKKTHEFNINDLVQRLCDLDKSLTHKQMLTVLDSLGQDSQGIISLDKFLDTFGQVDLNNDEQDEYQKAQEDQFLQDQIWPHWVAEEGKMAAAQNLIYTMYNYLQKNHGVDADQAFSIYDMSDTGTCTQQEFKRIIKIFFGDIVPEGEKLDFLMRLTVVNNDQKIKYTEFCKLLNKQFVSAFKLVQQNIEKTDGDEKKKQSAFENELDRPTIKESTLNYILRKAMELQIDLRQKFSSHDPLELSIISRVDFWGILISLPLGLNENELEVIFNNDLNFDNNGNVDYMSILNSDIFVMLERKRLTNLALLKSISMAKRNLKANKKQEASNKSTDQSVSDNRKVVVEDLIFIDDLEIIIYTTVRPKTSTIFITSICKAQKNLTQTQPISQAQQLLNDSNSAHSINDQQNFNSDEPIQNNNEQVQSLSYSLIAKLRGHKNKESPSICYIPQSNCLVSAEKYSSGNSMPSSQNNMPKNDDPDQHPSHKVQNFNKLGYSQYTQRHNNKSMQCEILIWNLQKDIIEKFSTNYPWDIQCHKKWVAHDASIIDICYLQKSQLLVTAALDQTIRFWDPVQISYELTDPQNNPHAQLKPGYYKPLESELTKSNATFKEVKRIYCGIDTNCYALRALTISNVILNSQHPEIKSQIEWLVCLKNPKQNPTNKESEKQNRVGIICGYGIERVKIEVPAKHLDDVVPPYIIEECEELCEQRRRKIVTAFQKQLPITINKIYDKTQLQNSYMEKIRALFMQAILNRKDGQFVNPIPLREVYKFILKLPARTKFESFLASSGCSDKLSMSETFFYLQKFMQIHPLRTTQIEFEKSIEDFYNKHQRQFLQGVKRWPKAAIQKLADFIRKNGLDATQLVNKNSEQQNERMSINFCTRERFTEYLYRLSKTPPYFNIQKDEIESIINELDPYSTGTIQISLVLKYFREEIEFNKLVTNKKPQEIIDHIRTIAFPNRKIALQQSLASADKFGDSFISKKQWLEAMKRADIVIDQEQLELLFDVMSERFYSSNNEQEILNQNQEDRYLNLPVFYSKLFFKSEIGTISEIDSTLQNIKAALYYKGIDFSIIFAETQGDDQEENSEQSISTSLQKLNKFQIDLTQNYTKFQQQIMKEEFCIRVSQLNSYQVTDEKILRLANYLSLNQKNTNIIYRESWLHHLRRVNTLFNVVDKETLPLICVKLLKNEKVFRSYLESVCMIRDKKEDDKYCDKADIRQILQKFGINYQSQTVFLQEFISNDTSILMENLISRMKELLVGEAKQGKILFQDKTSQKSDHSTPQLSDLIKTVYYANVQDKIRNYLIKNKGINFEKLLLKIKDFDEGDTGVIHVFKLINIMKHQFSHFFDDETLIGLQQELEFINETVDYVQFLKIFLEAASEDQKLNQTKTVETKMPIEMIKQYEDLLAQISNHIRSQRINLLRIFKMFSKNTEFISSKELKSIFELISFPVSESQFNLIFKFSNKNDALMLYAYDLYQQIDNAELVSPYFNKNKWINAAKLLEGRHNLLEMVYDAFSEIKSMILKESKEKQLGYQAKVVTSQQLKEMLSIEVESMSNYDIERVADYCIEASKTESKSNDVSFQQASNIVQIEHFEWAILDVINEMRNIEIQNKQEQQRKQNQAPEISTVQNANQKKQLQKYEKDHPDQYKREVELIQKITSVFQQREICFQDAFQEYYDPIKETNIIQIKLFKELINKLNLQLTMQDQRILRRIADPDGIGKVDLLSFCNRFETQYLRTMRLNQTLDKLTIQFYTQSFNLRNAFQLYDVKGDGNINILQLRQVFATLDIGVSYNEINDLTHLVQISRDGKLNYDDFIKNLHGKINQKRENLISQIDQQIFKNISAFIEESGANLYEAMKIYDTQNLGNIQSRDLTRVFKRLGLQQIEPHMKLIFRAGDILETDNYVNIDLFFAQFMETLKKKQKKVKSIGKQTINRLYGILKANNLSLFDFFVKLDTNKSGKLSKVELKTGIQIMNLILTRDEFEMLWLQFYKSNRQINMQQADKDVITDVLRPPESEISYYDLVNGFIQCGALKKLKTTDKTFILVDKFRKQMKHLNILIEKLYQTYDSRDLKYVFKDEFIETSLLMGFEFSEKELIKIFDLFCSCKVGDIEVQASKGQPKFNFQQMQETLLVKRDSKWVNKAYVKIHSTVLQKGQTYKRLFTLWKPKKLLDEKEKKLLQRNKDDSKLNANANKLNAKELSDGLKSLNSGLTHDEIDHLVSQLHFESQLKAGAKGSKQGQETKDSKSKTDNKDPLISDKDFEETIYQGAKELEGEKSHDRMLLVEWINKINQYLDLNFIQIDSIFAEYDSTQDGKIDFDDFSKMNESLGVSMNRKQLHTIFNQIDRNKTQKIELDSIKNLSKIVNIEDDQKQSDLNEDYQIEEQVLQGNQLILKKKINDIYDQLKHRIEIKKITLEQALFTNLGTDSKKTNKEGEKDQQIDSVTNNIKFNPKSLLTIQGVKQVLEKFQILITSDEAERIILEVRAQNFGKVSVTYKHLVDFMTKKRINIAFLQKGFIDPLLANTVQSFNKVKDSFELTYEEMFKMLDAENKGYFSKEQFMICIQGMNLGCSGEDIIDLFNNMDEKNMNRVKKDQFVNSMTFINQKLGGPSLLEESMNKGLIKVKKGNTNMQLVFSVLRQISGAVQRRRLSIRQLCQALDINRSGYVSRAEFVIFIHNLQENIPLDSLRTVIQFLDDKATGKISIFEFIKIVLEILNQQIGGGVYAFMQVKPIIQKIINELSVDCDVFFDKIAKLNQEQLDAQIQNFGEQHTISTSFQHVGLLKSIFNNTLLEYGVVLTEKEMAIISSVFGLGQKNRDKLDYIRLDSAFEGVQQQLYSQQKPYTAEWERRIYRKVSNQLIYKNESIHDYFSFSLLDDQRFVSTYELQQTLIQGSGLTQKQAEEFFKRDDVSQQITQQEFIQRLWSASIYEDIYGEESQTIQELETHKKDLSLPWIEQAPTPQMMTTHNINACYLKVKSKLDSTVAAYRVFKNIQKIFAEKNQIQENFKKLDTNSVGFLTIKDLQNNLIKHFNIELKQSELRYFFKELDTNQSGVIRFSNFESFYNSNYNEKVKQVQQKSSDECSINQIFNYLIDVLKKRGKTLKQVFQQIDHLQKNYIEVDEFHDMIERMGFTMSQEQVFELLKAVDENFESKISYEKIEKHMLKLGYQIQDLDGNAKKETLSIQNTSNQIQLSNTKVEQKWRDKALELVIKTVKNKFKGQSLDLYFQNYDMDHDGYLTPFEFRKSLQDLKEPQIKQTQIERILHIIIEDHKSKALASIERICKLLSNYKYIQLNDGSQGNTSVLIDEDLFVYIVEKYDGISRLMEFVGSLEDKATYLQRHTYELGMRGLNMMSNQTQVQKLVQKSQKLSELYKSTLILLAGDITRLMKEEAILTVLDPTKNVDTIISDQNVGVLSAISLPSIENTQFDVDYTSLETLSCGAKRYRGVFVQTKEPVEILVYPSENLQYVSLDGKAYKRHLATELQVHRYLMGARFEEDDELQNPDAFNDQDLDIFSNIGKFEKKIGLSPNDKEIFVVNKQINQDDWINFDDFVHKNGGILNIPLFYHTDAPLYIIRHWANLLLQIISKIHDVSVVLRSLSTKQLWISRDGQRIRLGHVRGCGRVNNLGFLKSCPDIYLNLEQDVTNQNQVKTQSKGKDEAQGMFSNSALDSPFIAPEILFSKFSDQTAALDVWAFGMILFSLIFGKKPVSYYQMYKNWISKAHNIDTEKENLPFIPPAKTNFIYDPFSIDFENPFDEVDLNDLVESEIKNRNGHQEIQSKLKVKDDGSINFANFMKCISDLSYSGMFTSENSKKFNYKKIISSESETETEKDDLTSVSSHENFIPYRFAGQEIKQESVRKKFLLMMAKSQVLERKNELGLILDLIAACLDVDPKKRPTVQGLLHSPIFQLDMHEKTNAVRFSQNVIMYRSPQSCVSVTVTHPLRQICAESLKSPMGVYEHTDTIFKLFMRVEDAIEFNTSLPLEELNLIMTEKEKKRGIVDRLASQGVDARKLRVSPNAPLAAQLIEDKVIDMLLFLTFRFIKNYKTWNSKRKVQNEQPKPSKVKKESQKNPILLRMTRLLMTLVYQMHSYNTPMSPYVSDVISYVVKFFIGEEYMFGSDAVLNKTCSQKSHHLQAFLRERSFFRRENELNQDFKSDEADKLWHLEQKNKTFLDKSNYWCPELYTESLKIFKDAISESGQGQTCYPVICDFINSVSNNLEPTKIFSRQMSHLSMSFLIPMNRTSAYYNELIPIAESLSRLYNPDLEKAGKRCSLAMVRSVFQTGNSDKIKACLDMRVPKHLVHFIQDSDQEVRKECLYTYLEISKGLQDDDFEVIGKHAANLKREFSKQGYTKTAFDLHKALSMASQSEVLDAQAKIDKINATNRRGSQVHQASQAIEQNISATEAQCNYIKRTIALIEKNENEKYINFALDLPNLNFLASKRFLKEMAVCFESPVFIAPLVRLLKTPTELYPNKVIILEILKNLVCGNERVLIALNSPACDTYMTLLKILMMNTKMSHARQNRNSGISTQMKNTLVLQDKTVCLFEYMFEQRRPSIIRDISCIGSSKDLLKQQELIIPNFISLPEIMEYFDDFADLPKIIPKKIDVKNLIAKVKDLRCWVKHFFAVSNIPELTRIKAMQRSMNLLVKVLKIVWREYFRTDKNEKKEPIVSSEAKIDYMQLIRTCLCFFDWLCINDKFLFLFNEESGKSNLAFIINSCNMVLSQFRKPLASTIDSTETAMPPMEDLAFNDKANKAVQDKRKYDIFPFTDVSSILQNIQYQLVRKNDPFLNSLLRKANFGFVFGEQLILEYDFIRHCIDNCVESLVLMDSYVKKNEIRLDTFEYIMRSGEDTIKDQLIKSNFIERIFVDYVSDYREFNIQFSKIDLEFLAFRRSYPIRLEAISLLNTALMLRQWAPQIYTEFLMFSRRHLLIRNELTMLQSSKAVNSKEATCLLLFSILLESNDMDLVYVMVQEGAHTVIRTLMQEQPSLNKRHPVLREFINKF